MNLLSSTLPSLGRVGGGGGRCSGQHMFTVDAWLRLGDKYVYYKVD